MKNTGLFSQIILDYDLNALTLDAVAEKPSFAKGLAVSLKESLIKELAQ
ncbi:hypothetical protein [Bacillus swezeyi]|nr:hypothetical protein [Bacillus swezeyi]